MKILLLEDDLLVALGLTTLLADAGHEVRLIITDRRMPVLGGTEFALAVRVEGLARHAPLVLLSGHTGDLSLSERAPFALILTKPVSEEGLLEGLQEVAALHYYAGLSR